MDEKERYVKLLEDSHAAMRALLDVVDKDIEIYPTWTIKEILDHLTGWDELSETALRAYAVGEDVGTPAARGIDYYNLQSVATRESLSYEHSVKEWELARQGFIAALQALPEDKMTETFNFPWGHSGTIKQFVGIFIHHNFTHAEEIGEIIKKVQE